MTSSAVNVTSNMRAVLCFLPCAQHVNVTNMLLLYIVNVSMEKKGHILNPSKSQNCIPTIITNYTPFILALVSVVTEVRNKVLFKENNVMQPYCYKQKADYFPITVCSEIFYSSYKTKSDRY